MADSGEEVHRTRKQGFVGDGHAAQATEELGNALETSMDIEFTIDVQADGDGAPANPRLEMLSTSWRAASRVVLMKLFAGATTTNLVRWLQKMYSLNVAEASLCLQGNGIRHCRSSLILNRTSPRKFSSFHRGSGASISQKYGRRKSGIISSDLKNTVS